MKRKRFTQEFRNEAVDLVSRIGTSKAANLLGIGVSNLQRWRSLSNNNTSTASESEEDFEKENRRLRKENEYLK